MSIPTLNKITHVWPTSTPIHSHSWKHRPTHGHSVTARSQTVATQRQHSHSTPTYRRSTRPHAPILKHPNSILWRHQVNPDSTPSSLTHNVLGWFKTRKHTLQFIIPLVPTKRELPTWYPTPSQPFHLGSNPGRSVWRIWRPRASGWGIPPSPGPVGPLGLYSCDRSPVGGPAYR